MKEKCQISAIGALGVPANGGMKRGQGASRQVHGSTRESVPAMAKNSLRLQSKTPFQMIMNWDEAGYHGRNGDGHMEDSTLTCFPHETEETGFEDASKTSRQHIESLLRQIQEQRKQLHRKADDLREANCALKILLQRRTVERTETEEDILLNFKHTVEPYLDKLKNTPLTDTQECYLALIEEAINNVTSPLIGSLRSTELTLTPAELQVANLVKFGRSTKEIAETSNLSLRTVESHKRNIRKKLGITDRKMALRTFLMRNGGNQYSH